MGPSCFNIIKNFDSKFYNFNANYFYSIKNNNYINSIDKNKGSGNIMEKLNVNTVADLLRLALSDPQPN
jgi:hypothetical protein